MSDTRYRDLWHKKESFQWTTERCQGFRIFSGYPSRDDIKRQVFPDQGLQASERVSYSQFYFSSHSLTN